MSDLISRQDVIKSLEEYSDLFTWDDGGREKAILVRVISDIQKMPSGIEDDNCYQQGVIMGGVHMQTHILTELKKIVGDEAWTNI